MAVCSCTSPYLKAGEMAGISVFTCASCGKRWNADLMDENGDMPEIACGTCTSPNFIEKKQYGEGVCQCVSCGSFADKNKNFAMVPMIKDKEGRGVCTCPCCGEQGIPLARADEDGLLQGQSCDAIIDINGDVPKEATPEQVRQFRAKHKYQGM